MPFEIVRNDITNMQVDAIVNTANPGPRIGTGTDTRIHQVAGPALLEARRAIGEIARGDAAITPAYNLRAKYVIHTVGPRWWDGGNREALLRSCYDKALQLALENHCESVAFPLISTGYYRFPKDLALQIAISAFSSFLTNHEMQIYLVVFDGESYKLSKNLFSNVASYIDEHYAEECMPRVYPASRGGEPYAPRYCVGQCARKEDRERMEAAACPDLETVDTAEVPKGSVSKTMVPEDYCPPQATVGAAPCPPARAVSLAEFLEKTDAGFTETLLRLIDKTGRKDSDIYKKANLSKQHFSKIRNNPEYRPTKATAIALALALELDLAQTGDLIGRAGYALTNSSKFDLIIRYFIEQGNYNVVEINIALYEFDQPLLGA